MIHLVMVDLGNAILDDVKLSTQLFRHEFQRRVGNTPIRSDSELHSACKPYHPNWILEDEKYPIPCWVFSIQSQMYYETISHVRHIWKVQINQRQTSTQIYPELPNVFRLTDIQDWRTQGDCHYRILHYERNPRITVTQLIR